MGVHAKQEECDFWDRFERPLKTDAAGVTPSRFACKAWTDYCAGAVVTSTTLNSQKLPW